MVLKYYIQVKHKLQATELVIYNFASNICYKLRIRNTVFGQS
jgi:hypothetical protein